MTRLGWALSRISFCLFALAVGSTAQAIAPSPLQSAHWRFEEGPEFSRVSPRNSDVVLDSINDNDMRAFQCDACGPGGTMIDAAPTYVSTVPPAALQSGATNTLALDFIPNQDILSQEQEINNGIIAPGGGFTVEAAFRPNSVVAFQGIVAKEGRPGLGKFTPRTLSKICRLSCSRSAATMAGCKLNNGTAAPSPARADNPQVSSLAPPHGRPMVLRGRRQHRHIALALLAGGNRSWLHAPGLNRAQPAAHLYQGDDPNNPDWDRPWTIGRAEFGGGPADFFDGIIDEVRLSNTALSPSQFLFAPPLAAVPGDYNNNGKVDAADYVQWRQRRAASERSRDRRFGHAGGLHGMAVPLRQPTRERSALGGGAAVPEPSTIILGILAIGACLMKRTRTCVKLKLRNEKGSAVRSVF